MKEIRTSEGMWRTEPQECKTQDDLFMIQELTSTGEFKTIIGLYYRDDAKGIVRLHNAVIKKLTERTIRQVCEDSGIPITMTADGIEVGERCEPDYRAGIHKVGGMLSVYGFKMPMPDRVIIEYGMDPDMAGRRIIIDGDKVEIIDSGTGCKGKVDPLFAVSVEDMTSGHDEVMEYEE